MGKLYDVVFVNGKIFTADGQCPHAEALAVKDGVIVRAGAADGLAEQAEKVVDLKGRRVIPGFVDGHMHPLMQAEVAKQTPCLPPVVTSIADLVRELKQAAGKTEPGQWVEGWGYDEGKLAEGRSPTRQDLDQASTEVPICIVRTCGHIRCVNSKALEMAGINRDTPDPAGGEVERDENGEPTGILKETARLLLKAAYPAGSLEKSVSNLKELGDRLLSYGVTTIADMSYQPGQPDPYELAKREGFRQRVARYTMWDDVDSSQPFPRQPADTTLRNAGVKLVGDGSVSGRTAWCDKPYLNSDSYGMPVCSEEDIRAALAYCRANKCQLALHAMGERAIDRALELGWQEKNWMDNGAPHLRIEHGAMPTPQAIERAAKGQVAIVTQPVFIYAEIESYLRNLGLARTQAAYPIPALLAAGVPLSISTDAPATAWAIPYDPFVNLKAAVTRVAYDGTDCGPDNRIDIETAIRLYTAAAGPMVGFGDVGRLAPGYRADFAVLDRDILEVPGQQLDTLQVAETYMDGECVYTRP